MMTPTLLDADSINRYSYYLCTIFASLEAIGIAEQSAKRNLPACQYSRSVMKLQKRLFTALCISCPALLCCRLPLNAPGSLGAMPLFQK